MVGLAGPRRADEQQRHHPQGFTGPRRDGGAAPDQARDGAHVRGLRVEDIEAFDQHLVADHMLLEQRVGVVPMMRQELEPGGLLAGREILGIPHEGTAGRLDRLEVATAHQVMTGPRVHAVHRLTQLTENRVQAPLARIDRGRLLLGRLGVGHRQVS